MAFTEVAASLGVDNTGWGWGTTFLDADLDGDLDLAVTNGFSETGFEHDASRFFQNGGAPAWSFTDISDAIGFNDTLWGSSLVCFDLNHDGLPDLVQTTKVHPAPGPLRLLLGSGVTGRHWVRIVPRMPAPNHQAIGAVVRARVGATVQSRLVTAGISFMGQEPAESFFGLGTATRVDQVVVEWPDGKLTKRSNLLVDRAHAVDWHEIFADGFESGSTTAWQ
ncbi:MAG TPA: ASPIC/UnbV domain-containing protein [Thermoanaerobaculia bacterium]|nr:ASPIC/UnbV domain-containing protein [Thermoanaerobaculia bacterium]